MLKNIQCLISKLFTIIFLFCSIASPAGGALHAHIRPLDYLQFRFKYQKFKLH